MEVKGLCKYAHGKKYASTHATPKPIISHCARIKPKIFFGHFAAVDGTSGADGCWAGEVVVAVVVSVVAASSWLPS